MKTITVQHRGENVEVGYFESIPEAIEKMGADQILRWINFQSKVHQLLRWDKSR